MTIEIPEVRNLLALIRLAALDGYNKEPLCTIDEWVEESKKLIFSVYLAGREGK